MKILYLCNYYHRAMIFRDAINMLEKQGHTVLVFNSVEFGEPIDQKYKPIMDNKVVHRECYRKIDRYFYHIKQRKIYKSLIHNIDVSNFDLIHCHTLFNGGWVARKVCKKYGIPYIVTVRNTDLYANLKYPFFIPIARAIEKSARKILFLSNNYRNTYLNKCYFGKRKEEVRKKSEVVLNGLEDFWMKNICEHKETYHSPLRLLCVGKIDKNKNMVSVLGATHRLAQKGIQSYITLIGKVVDDGVRKELEKGENVEILPFMSKEELISYYRKSDIYVMPSFHETFGRVYAEAMTQGLPVIYTQGQGFDGIFTDGEVGYSVCPYNVDDIADKIINIIDDYTKISEKCVESVKIFDWGIISNQLNNIYTASGREGSRT